MWGGGGGMRGGRGLGALKKSSEMVGRGGRVLKDSLFFKWGSRIFFIDKAKFLKTPPTPPRA